MQNRARTRSIGGNASLRATAPRQMERAHQAHPKGRSQKAFGTPVRSVAWSAKPERKLQNDLQNSGSGLSPKFQKAECNQLAGGLGFEPRLTESESAVLPLNYPPPKWLKRTNFRTVLVRAEAPGRPVALR